MKITEKIKNMKAVEKIKDMDIINKVKDMELIAKAKDSKIVDKLKTTKGKIILGSSVLVLLLIGITNCGDSSTQKESVAKTVAVENNAGKSDKLNNAFAEARERAAKADVLAENLKQDSRRKALRDRRIAARQASVPRVVHNGKAPVYVSKSRKPAYVSTSKSHVFRTVKQTAKPTAASVRTKAAKLNAAPVADDVYVKELVVRICQDTNVNSGWKNMYDKVKLRNIRVIDINDKLKRTTARAEILDNGSVFNIIYTAQYTTDGKLYVTVKGHNGTESGITDLNKIVPKKAKAKNNYGISPNDRFAGIKIKIIELFRANMVGYPNLNKLSWKVSRIKIDMYDTIFEVEMTSPDGIKAYEKVNYDRYRKSLKALKPTQYTKVISQLEGYKNIRKSAVKKARELILNRKYQDLFLESGYKYPIDNNAYRKWLRQKKSPKTEKIISELQSKVKQLPIKFTTVTTYGNENSVKLEINGKDFVITYGDHWNNPKSDSGNKYPSLRIRKSVPYSKIIENRAAKFEKEYNYKEKNTFEKGEFETYKEYNKRVAKAKAKAEDAHKSKAYADLAKAGGLSDIYEMKAGELNKSYFTYDVENKKLDFYVIENRKKGIVSNFCKDGFITLDIFGNPVISSYRCYYTSSSEHSYKNDLSKNYFSMNNIPASYAKGLKKKLGYTWEIDNIKLCLKYNYRQRRWDMIKLLVLPNSSDTQKISKNNPWTIPRLGIPLVYVAPGSFQMGSNDKDSCSNEKPVHKVSITKGYWIGRHEVTQKEYQAVMGKLADDHHKNTPVVNISWHDAVKFCQKLTARERKTGRLPDNYEYRLPTEAEWEFAARGGVKTLNYKYSGSNNLGQVAKYAPYSANNVELSLANELGIHDMSGNVWEWCDDWCKKYTGNQQINPMVTDKTLAHVIRGGTFSSKPNKCRIAFRAGAKPDEKSKYIGFRIVLAASLSSLSEDNRILNKRAKQFKELMTAGNRALSRRKWEDAKESFRKALKIKGYEHNRLLLDGIKAASNKNTVIYVPSGVKTIQAAMHTAKAGDTIYLEPGDYRETVVFKEGVILRGSDKERCRILPVSATTAVIIALNCKSGSIQNLTVDGSGQDSAKVYGLGVKYKLVNGKYIFIASVDKSLAHSIPKGAELLTVNNAPFMFSPYALAMQSKNKKVVLQYRFNNSIKSVSIETHKIKSSGMVPHGIAVLNSSIEVKDCIISNLKGAGIFTSGNKTQLTAKNNMCTLNKIGVWVCNGSNADIEQNQCNKNMFGIAYFMKSTGKASDNVCSNNSEYGISVNQSRIEAMGNICSGNKYAIVYGQKASGKIIDNKCINNSGSGIVVDNKSTVNVESNQCYRNKLAGIAFLNESSGTVINNSCRSNKQGVYKDKSIKSLISKSNSIK